MEAEAKKVSAIDLYNQKHDQEKEEKFIPNYASFGIIFAIIDGFIKIVWVESKDVFSGYPKIGFPGGREKAIDLENWLKTLFREVDEEIGILINQLRVTEIEHIGSGSKQNQHKRNDPESKFFNHFFVVGLGKQVTLDLNSEKSDIEKCFWVTLSDAFSLVNDHKVKYFHKVMLVEFCYWLEEKAMVNQELQYLLASVPYGIYKRPSKIEWKFELKK